MVRPALRAGLVTRCSIEVEWEDDPAATGWLVRQVPGPGRYAPTGQPRWRAVGLEPGTLYEFRVVAVDEDHGESSGKAVIRVVTGA